MSKVDFNDYTNYYDAGYDFSLWEKKKLQKQMRKPGRKLK